MEEFPTLSVAKKREWFLKCTPQGGKEKRKILENAGIPAKGLGSGPYKTRAEAVKRLQQVEFFKHKSRGFIGLLALLVAVAIIAILFVKSTWFSRTGEGNAAPGTGFDAINRAKDAKNVIEERSRDAANQ